jgi:hypothetical protein
MFEGFRLACRRQEIRNFLEEPEEVCGNREGKLRHHRARFAFRSRGGEETETRDHQ